jgi:hypothetical protein
MMVSKTTSREFFNTIDPMRTFASVLKQHPCVRRTSTTTRGTSEDKRQIKQMWRLQGKSLDR